MTVEVKPLAEITHVKTGTQSDTGTRYAEVLYYMYEDNQGILA